MLKYFFHNAKAKKQHVATNRTYISVLQRPLKQIAIRSNIQLRPS